MQANCSLIQTLLTLCCPRKKSEKQSWCRLSNDRQTWNAIVGLADPGQTSSPRETYVSTSRSALHASVASFFVHRKNRCACCCPRSFLFCKGSGFGSSGPDDMASERWRNHPDSTLWLEGVLRRVAVKCCNSLRACFYGLVSSIKKEKFFTPIIFF